MDYEVVGYASGTFGLSVAARNSLHSLLAAGRSVRVTDIDPGGDRAGIDQTYSALVGGERSGRAGQTVNLFHMNPAEVLLFSNQWTRSVDWKRDPNVIVPFWELPLVPVDWEPLLQSMDAVMAPSMFVADAIKKATSIPVIHYPQAVFVPPSIRGSRERWSVPQDTVVFLCTFDPASDIERKNPWTGIEAFSRAFGTRDDVLLIIRLHGWSEEGLHAEAMELLERAVSDRNNVRLVRDKLSYDEVLSLTATCDVTVSTHRSEGLGLPLMEAMSLGRVALATGWSGNLDFMTADNSLLIDCRQVPVQSSHAAYGPEIRRAGQVWAEPDVQHTAELMRLAASDAALRDRIGKRAREDMAQASSTQEFPGRRSISLRTRCWMPT